MKNLISGPLKLLAAYLLRFLMVSIGRTLKFKITDHTLLKENAIFSIWHQCAFCLFEANPIPKSAVLTAKGGPGDVFTKAVEIYDAKLIQVPFDGNPAEASVSAAKLINVLKEGYNLMLAVDGPKGPLYEIKPGIFFLAKRAKKRIIPIGVAASKKLTLSYRWDKYFIPLPFSTVAIFIDMKYENDDKVESLKMAMFEAEKQAKLMLPS
jgi:hypothetical protein